MLSTPNSPLTGKAGDAVQMKRRQGARAARRRPAKIGEFDEDPEAAMRQGQAEDAGELATTGPGLAATTLAARGAKRVYGLP